MIFLRRAFQADSASVLPGERPVAPERPDPALHGYGLALTTMETQIAEGTAKPETARRLLKSADKDPRKAALLAVAAHAEAMRALAVRAPAAPDAAAGA